jgi:putative two-component system response regulator
MARDIALTHHERWDGGGYPTGLTGSNIPLAGRIVAITDFFDALSHDRPYRRKRDHAEIVATIESERDRHFDPVVTDAFFSIAATLEQST